MHDVYLEWEVLEHPHKEKNTDWYWALGLISLAIAVASFIFDNPLFGIFILLSALTLLFHSHRGPRHLTCQITSHGVLFHDRLYPYSSLKSFWIHEDRSPRKLVLTSEHFLVPHVHIPLSEADPRMIRDLLLNHIDEARHRHSVTETLAELLEHHL